MSDAAARRVVAAAVRHAAAAFGERLRSAYAIGSLAHGGFAEAVSDIDVALLLDRCDRRAVRTVARVRAAAREEHGAIAGRLSLFYGDWGTFARPGRWARMPSIDRLDLMVHGQLVYGSDLRDRHGHVPDRATLVRDTARFALETLSADAVRGRLRDPDALVADGPRAVTKAALFPVRFLYTGCTGRAGGNAEAVRWYTEQDRPHRALAEAALAWREAPPPPGEAAPLLRAHLLPLHGEFLTTFAALPAGVDEGLAHRLLELERTLHAGER